MKKRKVTLIIPDLLNDDKTNHLRNSSSIPALKKILTRGNKKKLNYPNTESLLFGLFDLTNELPVAAMTALAANFSIKNNYWLRADPVELRAGLSGIFLIGNSHLALQKKEIQLLREQLNQLLQEYNIHLHTPWEQAWLLELVKQPQINTVDLNSIIGKEISHYLPGGEEQKKWRCLLTEIQMLLHQSPINQTRENNNKPLVNSLWFWGEGNLPAPKTNHYSHVISNNPIVIGLAKWSGTNYSSLVDNWKKVPAINSSNAYDILVVGDHLMYEKEKKIAIDNQDYLIQLEKNWFFPLLTALKKRQLDELIFYPNYHSVFYFTRKNFWYWWRR